MWNTKLFSQFIRSYNKQDWGRLICGIMLGLLALAYPGHNKLQSLVINPGPTRHYTLPTLEELPYPVSDGVIAPSLSARAVVVQDASGKALIYSKNPDTQLMPASITKVMTTLVALDQWSDLDTIIEVKNEDRAIGQTIELERGERITLRNLLYGLLVHSGNDAALAVADNYPGGYSTFVAAMNQKAKDLHLDHTTFKNPSGIEQYGHVTTARDLAILASYALKNETIKEMVQTREVTVTDITGTITHRLTTTNELLGQITGLKGLKTGWTQNAGECLVSYIEREEGSIIVVVLGSLDRFGETAKLVDWTYAHHSWMIPSI